MRDGPLKRYLLGFIGRAVRKAGIRELIRSLSVRGLLPELVWQRLPHDVEFRFSGPAATEFYYVADKADDMARRLLWRGWSSWEPETTPLWCTLARDASLALDIGAYTGYFSLLALAANPDLEVHAFEPMEAQRQSLERNLVRNGWSVRTVVLPCAVGSFQHMASMRGSKRMELTAAMETNARDGIPIEVVTIDDHLKSQTVHLIKIDVEGAEGDVLRGARKTLLRDQPIIVCEILTNSGARQVHSALGGLSYAAFEISSTGLLPIRLRDFAPDPRFRNVLLAPVDRVREVQERWGLAGSSGRRVRRSVGG